MTEKTLKNSPQLLQIILDSIEGEVFVKDTHGKYLFVNRAFGKDFGVDPDEVIGKDDYFVFSPETADILQKNDKRIMVAKKAENVEESGVVKGRRVTYLTNKVPLIDDDGSVLGICGVGFDITRQKEMEEDLLASEAKYHNLVKNSYDIVYSVTPDGIITFVGPQVDRFGYAPEDIISKNFIEFVAPEQRPRVLNSFEKGTRDGTSFPTEFQWIGKNGKRYWVEAVGRTLYDESENPSLQIGVLRDIAERKRTEERLFESEARFQALYDSAPDMFVSVDAKTTAIRDCNQAVVNTLGYAKEEIIAELLFAIQNIAELLKPFLPETSEKILKQLDERDTESLFPRLDRG